ncbi:MAG: ATP-binding cassette domain-containing protein [Cyanobacteria bacterium SBLK]|nr:ATP-binding cassette domain-containing protein [Cyanobacteria bacterium SBLK]
MGIPPKTPIAIAHLLVKLKSPLLILDRIAHQYNRRLILDGISFTLKLGQILCLTGPSGCGKTTLLRMAAGLVSPKVGTIANGFSRTGYVFQDPRLLPWQTARENLAFGLKARGIGKSERDRAARSLGKQLGLESVLHYYPHQLSGGMRQRVALGRALAIEPDLLLLDEPFHGLDVGRRREFQALMLQLLRDRGLAACLVSHDLAEAVRLGDRLLVLSPSPSRIVHQWQASRSTGDRDEAYIYREVSQLLSIPQVSQCFGLQNMSSPSEFMRS